MSNNNPIASIDLAGLSAATANALTVVVAKLQTAADVSTANAAALSLTEVVTKLRALGA